MNQFKKKENNTNKSNKTSFKIIKYINSEEDGKICLENDILNKGKLPLELIYDDINNFKNNKRFI